MLLIGQTANLTKDISSGGEKTQQLQLITLVSKILIGMLIVENAETFEAERKRTFRIYLMKRKRGHSVIWSIQLQLVIE